MTQKPQHEFFAQLADECLELEARLAGKRMELATAQGDKEAARQHMHAMAQVVQLRYAARHSTQEPAQVAPPAAEGKRS